MPTIGELDHFDRPKIFGIPRRYLVLSTDFDRWSEDSLKQERLRLIQNPLELTYMISLDKEALDLYYPGIFDGSFTVNLEPSDGLKNLFQRFNAPNDQEFYQRVDGIINGFFTKIGWPKMGKLSMNSLNLMKQLYEDEEKELGVKNSRKTGEAKINHEARIKLQTLADGLMTHEYTEFVRTSPFDRLFDPLIFPLLYHTTVVLNGADLHDIIEDFTQNPDLNLQQNGNWIHILLKNEKLLDIDMEHPIYAQDLYLFLRSISDKKYPDYVLTAKESLEKNMTKIIRTVLRAPNPVLSWGLLAVDMSDRDDNARTLWRHPAEAKLRKYNETMDGYRIPSIILWFHHPENSPYPASAIFLKLLGSTDEELYGWIYENEELMREFVRLEEANSGPLIVPHIQQVILLDNTGNYRIYQRPGVIKEYHKFPRFTSRSEDERGSLPA